MVACVYVTGIHVCVAARLCCWGGVGMSGPRLVRDALSQQCAHAGSGLNRKKPCSEQHGACRRHHTKPCMGSVVNAGQPALQQCVSHKCMWHSTNTGGAHSQHTSRRVPSDPSCLACILGGCNTTLCSSSLYYVTCTRQTNLYLQLSCWIQPVTEVKTCKGCTSLRLTPGRITFPPYLYV